jgi:hypothetical protein
MKGLVFAIPCGVTVALAAISSPSVAQQDVGITHNTAKECLDDWRADRAKSQSEGITMRDYIAQCQDGFVPAAAVMLVFVPATAPDSGKVVPRRSLSKRHHAAAPGRKHSKKAVTSRSLREPRPHSMPRAATFGTNRTVTDTPTGADKREGTVDW